MSKKQIHIQENTTSFLYDLISDIRDESMPEVQSECHHCGCIMKYPIIARRSDIEDFQLIIDSACKVMRDTGITSKLLASIRTECFIAIARKKALDNED